MKKQDESSIEYLVRRKYPTLQLAHVPISLNSLGPRRVIPSEEKDIRTAADAYKTDLSGKSADEIAEMVKQEQIREVKQIFNKRKEEEDARYFNQPSALADFDYWSKRTDWTLDEALALSFGKNPKVVSWEKLKSVTQISEFAKEYELRRELLLSAARWNQLFDPVLPPFFLGWAKRMDVSVPTELVEAIERRGNVVGDWKTAYEKMKEDNESLRSTNQALTEGVASNVRIIEELQSAMQAQSAQLKDVCNSVEEVVERSWEGFEEDAHDYPRELDIAMTAWRAITNGPKVRAKPKEAVLAYLAKTYTEKELSSGARKRIATICNWEKSGGRPALTKTATTVSIRKK